MKRRILDFFSKSWAVMKRVYQRAGFYLILAGCLAVVGVSAHALRNRPPYVPEAPSARQADSQSEFAQRLASVTLPPASSTPTPSPSPVPSPSPTPGPALIWPVQGELLTGFSEDALVYSETMGQWQAHAGVDIAAALGQVVAAPAAGTVTECLEDMLMGYTVVIRHDSGYESRLSNLASLNAVSVGDRVRQGDTVGSVGQSALSEEKLAPHLHYELTLNGAQIDPARVIKG